MKLGFIILAHQDLHRAEQLTRFLAKNDCPVTLHIDLNVPEKDMDDLKKSLNHLDNITFSKREKCGWGQFSIVQATLNAAETLLEHHPDLTHVFLASGSCLPARPIKQLKAFLDRHTGVDFIESCSIKDEKWVKDGLDKERFTLFFPLSWRKHRFAFDRLVEMQRLFRIKRAVPENISPHMGSQWWCLTAETLRKIIEDPKRRENDQYFSKCWIPDESYFQSLARTHSDHIRPASLTFATFDSQGKPFLFYDDHLEHLPKTGAFFIRKAWPGAQKLYRELLKVNRKNFPLSKANEMAFNKIFDDANNKRNFGGEGRFLQGRYPHDSAKQSGAFNKNYGIFTGLGDLFQDFPMCVEKVKGINVFGNIFARKHFTFKKKIFLTKGNLTANARLRNTNPKNYLSNFLWSQKTDKNIGIAFDATDMQKIMPIITCDRRANFVVVKEAWLISIANSNSKFKGKLMRAQVLQAREQRYLKALATGKHAGCTVYTLDEALKSPAQVLQTALHSLDVDAKTRPIAIPKLADVSKLDALVRKLSKNGVSLAYKPIKKKKKALESVSEAVSRPYVVK